MSDVVVTRVIAASPATVFSFFIDVERWTSWQGVDGEIDAQPGGVIRIRMPGSQVASGRFVEVVPERRIVFTWGWEGEMPPVPPGSTTVVIELEPGRSRHAASPDAQRTRAAADRGPPPKGLGALPRAASRALRRGRPWARPGSDIVAATPVLHLRGVRCEAE